ncbi:hypothetical protein F4781DRAFT_106768 [Annulohypoxylon bovei var. microspora]|nr:hypothetical protein F4781DRAFT_106768 [Annulohypoxylon bovei var. microspora]
MASSSQSYSLQLAERIHNTTGQDKLPHICIGGFLLESFWNGVVEKRLLKTSPALVRKSLWRAAVFWPGVYLTTRAALIWAEWRVRKAKEERRENETAS